MKRRSFWLLFHFSGSALLRMIFFCCCSALKNRGNSSEKASSLPSLLPHSPAIHGNHFLATKSFNSTRNHYLPCTFLSVARPPSVPPPDQTCSGYSSTSSSLADITYTRVSSSKAQQSFCSFLIECSTTAGGSTNGSVAGSTRMIVDLWVHLYQAGRSHHRHQ